MRWAPFRHVAEARLAQDGGVFQYDGVTTRIDSLSGSSAFVDGNGYLAQFHISEFPDDKLVTPVLAALAEHKIDMAVLAGFLGILSADFIARFGGPIINIHPSLIPSFCGKGFYGLRVHQAALDYGVKVTGATVHYASEVVDGGQIIAQKAVDVLPGDTPEVLQRRVMEQAEWVILPKAIDEIAMHDPAQNTVQKGS